jgi:thiamine-phosphate pyrophosphorylase
MTQLYLLSPPTLEATLAIPTPFFQEAVPCVQAFQLRLKDASGNSAPREDVLRAAEYLRPLCNAAGIAFIANDDPLLARECGADGVHLGADDMPVAEARKLLGNDMTIGASCYDSIHLAMEAGEAGADYVAFGAFFPTATKTPRAMAHLELLESWSPFAVLPAVAIGGITPENCGALVRAGADFLAVMASVWHHPEGPLAALRAFEQAIQGATT